jgi:ParB-like chromosome segregation protein Spo0J
MLIEMWPIDRPKDYPKNARKWGAHAVEKVAASIREYGFRQPVVVDVSDVIVIGHLRRAAERFLGLPEIRCTWRAI